MQKISLAILVLCIAGCAAPTSKKETYDLINAEMEKAAQTVVQPAKPDAVSAALLPPLNIEMPKPKAPLEERFSLAFNNVPAAQFFNAIVTGTRYNMLVHPDVTGTISANLKDVTLFEALDAIKELYGYDYSLEGNRIVIKPLTMQTSIFRVNYLTGNRKGVSETSVISGSLNASQTNGNVGGTNNNYGGNNGNNGNRSGQSFSPIESSRVSTTTQSDFWSDLKTALDAIIGGGRDGRSVVISPQSGVIVVRAMPEELRNVSAYLKATQLSVDRQVILEAKILEVTLSNGYQTGINWSALHGNTRISGGFASAGQGASITNQIGSIPSTGLTDNAVTGNGFFGLALQARNFAGLISFLESQGDVHVLSSPRIATLNNQKAVLKVGTDDFFVTNVSNNINTSVSGAATTSTPNVTLQPFFSGVVLDVTPQIDEEGNIILHIHPSVTDVQTVERVIDLGTQGNVQNVLKLPLASSSTSETDSVVRAQDGNIIALGGLMRQRTVSGRDQIPVAGDVPLLGNFVKNTNQVTEKRELVILLKPTVIQNEGSWAQDVLDSQKRLQSMAPRSKPWE
ncbi:pilus (MSHA type) biogenesis protein MshL [Oxalicibacterium solurbis]|uniref:Pilus (MSHA type) biogenesis protein MshL n=1 Tax=Oxalicibacterium solurbis TaxID=69280 RepID=A0A8J3F505_9BURK|nr:pilus (MSHA type) biogenesis protein MshL [Oxalicibacterium solurbis]GGI53086.1 pilus (MSHA type) biogenesis protein MshL [Oxalicibacterium solurbis]